MADYDWEFDGEGSGFLPGLVLGALLGAAGALFVATKRSGELRRELSQLRDAAQSVTSTATQRGAHLLETARGAASEVAQTASEAASSVAGGAREVVQHAQETVQSAGGVVSSAQEAASNVAQTARDRVGDVAQSARDAAEELKTSVASALPQSGENDHPGAGDDEEDLAASGLETGSLSASADDVPGETSSDEAFFEGGTSSDDTPPDEGTAEDVAAEDVSVEDVASLAAQLEDALHQKQDEVLEAEADADDAAVGLEGRDFAGKSEGSNTGGKRSRKKRDAGDQAHDVIDAV